MISFLSGKPFLFGEKLIINVNGVGYGVMVGPKLLAKSLNADEIDIFVFTHVKEDKLDLYGFETRQELQLFEMVLSVSGIGPKIALSLVDAGPEKLIESVQQANVSFFSSIPRVGKKLAQKAIIELKSKLGDMRDLDLKPMSSKAQDILNALINLGFSETDAEIALESIDLDTMTVESAIKQALKNVTTN